jgi:hypothetical protein
VPEAEHRPAQAGAVPERAADPRLTGLPAHLALIGTWSLAWEGPFEALAAAPERVAAPTWRARAKAAAESLIDAVEACADQLIELVRSHTRDRIQAVWDSPAYPGGRELSTRIADGPGPAPAAARHVAGPPLNPVGVWWGNIDAAVVEHGDTPPLEQLQGAIGRMGIGALAAAAALDCPGAEAFLVSFGGQAGAAIVRVASEALSAGLLKAARDIVDNARGVLQEAAPDDEVGLMLTVHAAYFAEEDE